MNVKGRVREWSIKTNGKNKDIIRRCMMIAGKICNFVESREIIRSRINC